MANQKLISLCRKCRKLDFSKRFQQNSKILSDSLSACKTGLNQSFSATFLNICHGFFYNDPATTEIYTLSLPDALPISGYRPRYLAFGGSFVNGISKRTTRNIYFRE